MSYVDLREWIEQVDAFGELSRIEGCDWNLEMGALAEVAGRGQDASALLFDNIKDYPPGYRVLVGMVESLKRAALTTNLPADITRNEFIAAWRERLNKPVLIPPEYVDDSPLFENVLTVDDDIDVADIDDVLWALCTRCNPADSIDILRRTWSGPLDPIVPREEKGLNSRAIIDACRPFEWAKDFPPVSGASNELKQKVLEKYGHYLKR